VAAFEDPWPIAEDFEIAEGSFSLGQEGTVVRVYRRIRPTTPEVAIDTARRVSLLLGLESPSSLMMWRVLSSDYPTQVVETGDGVVELTAHPARRSNATPTRFELITPATGSMEIAGSVWFYDRHCSGVELVALNGTGLKRQEQRLGAFFPRDRDAGFSATVLADSTTPLWLDVRSQSETPEDIDYCTLIIRDLRVKAGG